MSNVTSIDQPRCSLCGAFKPDEELGGYDPLAPVGQKYKSAYCVKVAECDSKEAKATIDKVISHLESE